MASASSVFSYQSSWSFVSFPCTAWSARRGITGTATKIVKSIEYHFKNQYKFSPDYSSNDEEKIINAVQKVLNQNIHYVQYQNCTKVERKNIKDQIVGQLVDENGPDPNALDMKSSISGKKYFSSKFFLNENYLTKVIRKVVSEIRPDILKEVKSDVVSISTSSSGPPGGPTLPLLEIKTSSPPEKKIFGIFMIDDLSSSLLALKLLKDKMNSTTPQNLPTPSAPDESELAAHELKNSSGVSASTSSSNLFVKNITTTKKRQPIDEDAEELRSSLFIQRLSENLEPKNESSHSLFAACRDDGEDLSSFFNSLSSPKAR